MLVKYKNDYQIKAANNHEILIDGDKQIINPRDEDFVKVGYKQLIETEQPIYDEEIQYLIPYYELDNDEIYQKWEVRDIEITDFEEENIQD